MKIASILVVAMLAVYVVGYTTVSFDAQLTITDVGDSTVCQVHVVEALTFDFQDANYTRLTKIIPDASSFNGRAKVTNFLATSLTSGVTVTSQQVDVVSYQLGTMLIVGFTNSTPLHVVTFQLNYYVYGPLWSAWSGKDQNNIVWSTISGQDVPSSTLVVNFPPSWNDYTLGNQLQVVSPNANLCNISRPTQTRVIVSNTATIAAGVSYEVNIQIPTVTNKCVLVANSDYSISGIIIVASGLILGLAIVSIFVLFAIRFVKQRKANKLAEEQARTLRLSPDTPIPPNTQPYSGVIHSSPSALQPHAYLPSQYSPVYPPYIPEQHNPQLSPTLQQGYPIDQQTNITPPAYPNEYPYIQHPIIQPTNRQ